MPAPRRIRAAEGHRGPGGAPKPRLISERRGCSTADATGDLGVWVLGTGERLLATRLHGPVARVVVRDSGVVALSEVGDWVALNLTPLVTDRGALLGEIRRAVPVLWRGGRAVLGELEPTGGAEAPLRRGTSLDGAGADL